jgi:type IV pilus assembly protein PilY1
MRRSGIALLAAALLGAVGFVMVSALASAPTLPISQVPLTLAASVRPLVLLAVGNSQSMDGTLSGAIMTGSGSLGTSLSALNSSSSPVSYAVPAGFTPPVQAADSSGNAPYSVNVGGVLTDNGASRLNVAKGGIQAILQAYMQNTDFALADYSISNVSLYTTWVYYMSPAGANFSFTNTESTGSTYVANPCFGYVTSTSATSANCSAIASAGLAASATLNTSAWMQIGASSDDPTINDVLYAPPGSQPGVYINYGGANPATPFPPNFDLSDYNAGGVVLGYPYSAPGANRQTGPTNAGYVPYSPQVMYAERGYGYYGGQAANTGNIAVKQTTAGTNPTAASVNAAIAAFTPFLQPETNNVGSGEIKAAAVQSPIAGLLSAANAYLTGPDVRTTDSNGCDVPRYVVLISDGLPTEDLNGGLWPPLGSAAAVGYGVTATFNADGSLAATNDQALTDTLSTIATLKAAGIKTYIIGLGAGVDPSANTQAAATLQAMAMAGGTAAYYPATSPAALVSDLNTILISVQNASVASTASSVNSTQLSTSSFEYQASFISSDSPYQDWTGEVYAKALDPATGKPTGPTLWSAQALLDTKLVSTRLIATWNPALPSVGTAGPPAGPAGAGAPFEWSNGDPTQAISAAQRALLQPTDTLGQSRLAYLRGDTSQEKRNGGAFRNRSHILGDIVDSQPAYVGPPSGAYFSTSYFAFQTAQKNRPAMIYAGANDGMLHAFNANPSAAAGGGVEQFAFIPNGVFANLYQLSAPLYNQSHLFFVDGSPQSGDVQFADSTWHTLLVGGENAGGRSVYALDVTNPQDITSEIALANKVLWEFSDSSDLGLTYGEPRIAPVAAAPGFAVFFGNGYNSPNNHAVLYALNPQTGATIAKLDLCTSAAALAATACNAGAPQGLSSVAVGNSDGLRGQPVTEVYGGDLQGNLWVVDVGNPDPTKWTVRLLFQARDPAGNPQPITTSPMLTLNPNYPREDGLFVMFGTGQFLTQNDLTNLQTQTVYGVWDQGATAPYHRSNLQQQVLAVTTVASSAVPVLTDTNNAVSLGSQAGWYDDLPIPGQRVMTDPQLLNGSFITALNTPPTSSCGGSASAMLLEINYATGGAFALPQLDVNGDGVINSGDVLPGGGNAVGLGLGTGYASAPTMIGPTGAGYMDLNFTMSGGNTNSQPTLNNGSRISAWRQLQ